VSYLVRLLERVSIELPIEAAVVLVKVTTIAPVVLLLSIGHVLKQLSSRRAPSLQSSCLTADPTLLGQPELHLSIPGSAHWSAAPILPYSRWTT
jgi:hypothetical protein